MRPAGFEPEIPASEGPQIHALDGAATGIGRGGIQTMESNIYFE
jgi:hypothetical protein